MTDTAIAGSPTSAVSGAAVRRWVTERGAFVAVIILVLYNILFTSHFTELNNLQLQMNSLSTTLLVSLGMLLVIGTGGIDLSVGSVLALGAATVALYLHLGVLPAIAITLAVGAICGAVSGMLVSVFHIQPIIATLVLFIGARAFAQYWSDHQTQSILITIGNNFVGRLYYDKLGPIPYPVLISLTATALVGFVVRRTLWGRLILAVGDNLTASRYTGLPVRRTLMTVDIVSGVLAAIAGIIAASGTGAGLPATEGLNFELNAITAVVVGGTALTGGRVRVLGTLAGVIFVSLLTSTLIKHNVQQSVAWMVQALVIILAVYLQSGEAKS
jgi:galactofuranose transport system permease protein